MRTSSHGLPGAGRPAKRTILVPVAVFERRPATGCRLVSVDRRGVVGVNDELVDVSADQPSRHVAQQVGPGRVYPPEIACEVDHESRYANSRPRRPTRLRWHPARVLVVDDNSYAADMLGMMLALSGCDIRKAYTAAGALELALEFARMLLIATTGWGQDRDRQSTFDAGFDRHLTKPIDFGLLHSLLAPASAS